MCNGIPVLAIADLGDHDNSESLHSKNLYRYCIHVLHYRLQKPSERTWFHVNKLILGAHKAKINWLRA